MAGYVTDFRVLNTGVRTFWVKHKNGTSSEGGVYPNVMAYPDSVQTTTSFRSRGIEDPDWDVTQAVSQFDFIKKLREEKLRDGSGFDNGHPFSTEKKVATLSHPLIDTGNADHLPVGQKGRYVGPLSIGDSSGQYPSWPTISAPDWAYYGTQAIGITAPTNPASNLAVSIGELFTEGIPGVGSVKSALLRLFPRPEGRRRPKKRRPGEFEGRSSSGHADELSRNIEEMLSQVSEANLLAQFGFIPTGTDIGNAVYAFVKANDLIRQYKRDSGRVVRRRTSFPTGRYVGNTSYTGVITQPGSIISIEPAFIGGTSGQVGITLEISRRYWFSGAYQYFVPPSVDTWSARFSSFRKVTGLELTPETVWNLTPFSWLLGWKVNIGDVLHNVSEFSTDSLVLRYGYLMCETRMKRTYTHGSVAYRAGGASGLITNSFEIITKERVKATPYGFGLNPNSFSNRQWSILTALGWTKGPSRVLRTQ